MKKLACLLMVCLLFGCQTNSNQIKSNISKEITTMAKSAPFDYTTMNKPLYSYYLPKDIGRIDSNDLSSLLVKDGVKIIMNFNPNSVVIKDYYQKNENTFYVENEINVNYNFYYQSTGTYLGKDYKYYNYSVRIMKLDDTDYLLYLDMGYVNFTSIVKEVQLSSFIHSCFVIAKSIDYDSKEVVTYYSLQSTSDSIKQDLEEFNEQLPNDGSLSDLIDKSK